MPLPLRNLCIFFVAILAAGATQSVFDAFTSDVEDASFSTIVFVLNLMPCVISAAFIYVVWAFSKRVRWSLSWLQTLAAVNVVMIAIGMVFIATDAGELALVDKLSMTLSTLEMLTCAALWLTLRKASTKQWFADGNR